MSLYYRLFLLVPLVLAIVGATVPLLRDFGIFQTAMVVMFAGGIPYLFFVVCALVWSFKHPDKEHTKAFVLSPLVFGLFCFIYGFVQAYVFLSGEPALFGSLGVASTYAVIGCVVSAVYSWGGLFIWWLICVVR